MTMTGGIYKNFFNVSTFPTKKTLLFLIKCWELPGDEVIMMNLTRVS